MADATEEKAPENAEPPVARVAKPPADRPGLVDISEYAEANVKIIDANGNVVPHPHVPQDESVQVDESPRRRFSNHPETGNRETNGGIALEEAMAPGWPAYPEMLLDEFNDAALFEYSMKRAEASPALNKMYANRYAKTATPEDDPVPPPAPMLALPEEAPRLWADRPQGMKAAQFLRETYAPWIEAGVLTRTALRACDRPLYQAYHVWVHRHPEDAVPFKDAPPSNMIVDPAEAIERHRENVRNAMTRYRAKKAMEPSPTS